MSHHSRIAEIEREATQRAGRKALGWGIAAFLGLTTWVSGKAAGLAGLAGIGTLWILWMISGGDD